MKKVSVVMPVYNGEKFLKEAIASVLSQSFTDFELLVMDDGSTDASVSVARSFSDPRIRIVTIPHGGIVNALNQGIEAAAGEYIIRQDADDVSLPNRFSELVRYMDGHPAIALCGSWATTIDEQGIVMGEMKYPPLEARQIRKYALLHNPFIHPSVVIRKSVLTEVGGYRSFRHVEDYELWTRVLARHPGHNLAIPLLRYRLHSGQITRSKNLSMRMRGIAVRLLALYRLR